MDKQPLCVHVHALNGQTATRRGCVCPGQDPGAPGSRLWGFSCVKSTGQCCPLWSYNYSRSGACCTDAALIACASLKVLNQTIARCVVGEQHRLLEETRVKDLKSRPFPSLVYLLGASSLLTGHLNQNLTLEPSQRSLLQMTMTRREADRLEQHTRETHQSGEQLLRTLQSIQQGIAGR